MFLSRLLTPAEKNYWVTELEVSCITWTIKKVRHLIETAQKPVIFYTDHSATIAVATSLRTSSRERLNLRLVRASMYMQQFPIKIFHRPGKTNRIADALSRLPSAVPTPAKEDDDLEALIVTLDPRYVPFGAQTDDLDCDPTTYALQTPAIQLSDEFQAKIKDGYESDPRWKTVIQELDAAANEGEDPMVAKLPYTVEDGLLYSVQDDGSHWLCTLLL
ncbi:hypothetical protein VN97_g3108 [Penicillium thymicola]|uniref:Reverse transcriptase RNase H-like domain-containing protein n=1 Tax=Penicillium thymicola TaxID=293382 RepID=A0AAI9XAT7_PENTH|nr:hypothetical protein VN97_g3108 [Penicillium thymicola]